MKLSAPPAALGAVGQCAAVSALLASPHGSKHCTSFPLMYAGPLNAAAVLGLSVAVLTSLMCNIDLKAAHSYTMINLITDSYIDRLNV